MKARAKHDAEWQDPIVAEVRAAREALFAAAGRDIREFVRRARAAQAKSRHPVVSRCSHGAADRKSRTVPLSRSRRKTG
jgi:hypothetical protein